MPIHYIKKVPSKILYFGHSVDIIRSKLGCMPIYGHTYIAHNSVIFRPIPNIVIYGCSGDDYLPGGGGGVCIIKLSSMQHPFTGKAFSQ